MNMDDIDSQLASVLTEEEYSKYINNKFNDDCIDIEQLMLFYNEYNVKSLTQLMVKQDMLMMKLVIDIRCQQMIMQLVDFLNA